jgi:hypothetical protein
VVLQRIANPRPSGPASSILAVGVLILLKAKLILQEFLTKNDLDFSDFDSERFHECKIFFESNEWGREHAVGVQ